MQPQLQAQLGWHKCVRMLQPSGKRRMILIHPLVSRQTRIGHDSWTHQLLSPCPKVQPSLCLCLFCTNAVIPFVCCRKYPSFAAGNTLRLRQEIPFVCCRKYPLFAAGNTLCLRQQIPFVCCRKYPSFAAGNTLRLLQEMTHCEGPNNQDRCD